MSQTTFHGSNRRLQIIFVKSNFSLANQILHIVKHHKSFWCNLGCVKIIIPTYGIKYLSWKHKLYTTGAVSILSLEDNFRSNLFFLIVGHPTGRSPPFLCSSKIRCWIKTRRNRASSIHCRGCFPSSHSSWARRYRI